MPQTTPATTMEQTDMPAQASEYREEPEEASSTDSSARGVHPKGWPSLAQLWNDHPNLQMHRSFSYLRERIIQYKEGRIGAHHKSLLDLDKQDEESNSLALFSLSPAQLQLAWEEQGDKTKKDKFFDVAERDLKEYDDALLRQNQMYRFRSIGPREHKGMLIDPGVQCLTNEGKLYLQAGEDFISTRAEKDRHPLESLFYCEDPTWFHKLFMQQQKPEEDAENPTGSGVWTGHVSVRPLNYVVIVATVLISLLVMLVPVIILYLAALTKGENLAVVAISLLMFTVLMATILGRRALFAILMSAAAYMAVLVCFLANVQVSLPQQGI